MKEPLTLADKLIAHRQRRGLSQESLAEAANLSLRTVQRIEKGENIPRGVTLQALATALQLPVEALSSSAEPDTAPVVPVADAGAAISSADVVPAPAQYAAICLSLPGPGHNYQWAIPGHVAGHRPECRAAADDQ